jgi:hypothetical protein
VNMRLLTLLIHMCLLSTVGCFISFLSGGIYLPGSAVVGALYSTSCVSYDSHATTTKHAAAALTMAQKPHHDELVLVAFLANPMPIATHPPIGHDLPYRPMHGNWHGLVEMAAKRHSHKQQCKAAGSRLSLLYKI